MPPFSPALGRHHTARGARERRQPGAAHEELPGHPAASVRVNSSAPGRRVASDRGRHTISSPALSGDDELGSPWWSADGHRPAPERCRQLRPRADATVPITRTATVAAATAVAERDGVSRGPPELWDPSTGADLTRRNGRLRRRRAVPGVQGGRGTAIPQPPHRRVPSTQRLRQASDQLAQQSFRTACQQRPKIDPFSPVEY